ncbi:MAG: P-loop NTPase [Deltaproteobacteria bacterium]|nr:P-loop NTPase [Deltaproteobacteria bacterium]
MLDPRICVIEKRLSQIKDVIAVSGGKGGVGKSTVASLLALFLSVKKKSVGLFDLDFYGPSTQLILGIDGVKIEERMGVIPPQWRGISYMSISLFTKGNPLPIRGKDISNVIMELLSVTLWNGLDYLILDMPPGTGESLLDVLRLIRRTSFLLVSTPSRVAHEVLKKELAILKRKKIHVLGVIENQRRDFKNSNLQTDIDVPLIGTLPYDEKFESAIGIPEAIMKTDLYLSLERTLENVFT